MTMGRHNSRPPRAAFAWHLTKAHSWNSLLPFTPVSRMYWWDSTPPSEWAVRSQVLPVRENDKQGNTTHIQKSIFATFFEDDFHFYADPDRVKTCIVFLAKASMSGLSYSLACKAWTSCSDPRIWFLNVNLVPRSGCIFCWVLALVNVWRMLARVQQVDLLCSW